MDILAAKHIFLSNQVRFKAYNGDKNAYIFSYMDQHFNKDTREFLQSRGKLLEKNHSFTSVVLKRFPDDDDGKLLLERIDRIILERKKGAEGVKKKTSKKVGTSCLLRSSKMIGKPNSNIPKKHFSRLHTRGRNADGMQAGVACLLVPNYLFACSFTCMTDRHTDLSTG